MSDSRSGRPARALFAAAVTFTAAARSPAALACSTCKCADPTITLLGLEKSYENRVRVGVDTIVRSETSGTGVGRVRTDEWRTLVGAAWSPTPSLSLAVQLPYVRKTLEAPSLARVEAQGLGDLDVVGRAVLYRSGSITDRHLAGLRAGVRLPTASRVRSDGAPVDIDAQPDAGAVAPSAGAWYAYFRYPVFVTTSVTGLIYGDGRQGFSPGDAVLGSVLAQYAVNQPLALQTGLDLRWSGRNRFDGVVDPDSGGVLGMAWTGAALRVGGELLLAAGVQWPLLDRLHGRQDEAITFRASVAYDF